MLFNYFINFKIPIKEQEFILVGENSQKGFDDLVVLLHRTIQSKFFKINLSLK